MERSLFQPEGTNGRVVLQRSANLGASESRGISGYLRRLRVRRYVGLRRMAGVRLHDVLPTKKTRDLPGVCSSRDQLYLKPPPAARDSESVRFDSANAVPANMVSTPASVLPAHFCRVPSGSDASTSALGSALSSS